MSLPLPPAPFRPGGWLKRQLRTALDAHGGAAWCVPGTTLRPLRDFLCRVAPHAGRSGVMRLLQWALLMTASMMSPV